MSGDWVNNEKVIAGTTQSESFSTVGSTTGDISITAGTTGAQVMKNTRRRTIPTKDKILEHAATALTNISTFARFVNYAEILPHPDELFESENTRLPAALV